MKSNLFISMLLNIVWRGSSVLTSETGCSSYSMKTNVFGKSRSRMSPRPSHYVENVPKWIIWLRKNNQNQQFLHDFKIDQATFMKRPTCFRFQASACCCGCEWRSPVAGCLMSLVIWINVFGSPCTISSSFLGSWSGGPEAFAC